MVGRAVVLNPCLEHECNFLKKDKSLGLCVNCEARVQYLASQNGDEEAIEYLKNLDPAELGNHKVFEHDIRKKPNVDHYEQTYYQGAYIAAKKRYPDQEFPDLYTIVHYLYEQLRNKSLVGSIIGMKRGSFGRMSDVFNLPKSDLNEVGRLKWAAKRAESED